MAEQSNYPDFSALLAHRAETINLAAGPSSLPTSVLLEATSGLLDYAGTGIGLSELSHRSSAFQSCVDTAKADLRALLDIPEDFDILFLQGGGLTQFAMVPLNLVSSWKITNESSEEPVCEYVVSGSWSQKAAGEARRLGCDVNVVVDNRKSSKDGKTFGEAPLPPSKQWAWTAAGNKKPAYIYYCSNETVNGIELPPPSVPEHLKDVPLVADMSSNILSRPIPWKENNLGLVYAGAQKNIGPAGLTIVIVRKDLLADVDVSATKYSGPRVPAMLAYKTHADNGSLYNTPPMFPIYVAGLVFKHLAKNGGVSAIEKVNKAKADAVWDLVDDSNGFYVSRVEKSLRSRMNICFLVPGDGRGEAFIAEAGKRGIKQIKGHRSVGGIRTSLYNAVTLDQVHVLTKFMTEFMEKHR